MREGTGNDDSANNAEGASTELGEIDIVISNVVSTFFTRCHLNLKQICLNGMNVIYNQENKVVSMKLKKPSITASIWSSGKITCAGANSEEESLRASRKVARCLWRIGFQTKFARFKIVNVLGTVHLPFNILLSEFSNAHPKIASYEPELHPGVTFKLENPKASLKIFHTGSITIAAPSASKVKEAMEIVYPMVFEYRLLPPPSLNPPSLPPPSLNLNHALLNLQSTISYIPENSFKSQINNYNNHENTINRTILSQNAQIAANNTMNAHTSDSLMKRGATDLQACVKKFKSG